MTTLAPGARLGPYDILSSLGEGGMGVVYRARDTRLQRDVAIKVLLPAVASDPDRLARFRREAQVLASLNHPNIAAIYGLEESGGVQALVMELVEGPTLAERIGEPGPRDFAPDAAPGVRTEVGLASRSRPAGLPIDEALAIARQLIDALDAAHEHGVVHRDLKPANIKVRPDGTVKVLDFGLAKAMDSGPGAGDRGVERVSQAPTITSPAMMTGVGMILGTAAYMSPEQASGKPVDKRADIWAFGVVLWEMVTGRRMFEGETVSHVLAAVLTKEPDLAAAPPRVRHLLARCLEKDPNKRLRDIGDAMSLLSEPVVDERVETPSRRRTPALAWALAGTMAVALVLALWLRPDPAGPTEAPAVRLQIARPSVDPYNNAAAAFALSPDGRYLAYYVSGADGRATLSLQTLASGERREVPGSALQSPAPPFWSHDSRQVVYMTLSAVSVFDIVTGTTRELCACRFRGGSWNRDGVILLGASPAESGPIRRLSLDDLTPVAVTSVGDVGGAAWDNSPVFLPDGWRFLFTRTRATSESATYMGTLDGGEPRRIADGSRTLFADLPGLGPQLLGIDAAGLVAQPLDAGSMAASGQPVLVLAGAASASISANGVLAASAPADNPITVPAWFDRRGTRLGDVGPVGEILGVAVAPDGRTVAVNVVGREDPGLWLRDAAGSNRRLAERGDAPVWSPDGLRILMTLGGVPRQVYEQATDGSGQQQLLFPADRNAFTNDWSRDGQWLLYTLPKGEGVGGPDLDLWALPLAARADRTPVPYLAGAARDAQAEFSPDGRFVAYTSVENGAPQVYVQPFPNAADGRWLVSSGGGSEPRWSRDGTELFYFAGQALMVAPVKLRPNFSSGPPTRLFDAPVQPWYINDTDRWQVAPDGKRFLLLVPSGDTAAPPIDVVVNWPALLPR